MTSNKSSAFAKLLEESFKKRNSLEIGAKFDAKITSIEADYVFLEIPQNGIKGVLLKEELYDQTVSVGSSLPVYFLYESHGDFYFTHTLTEENFNVENFELAKEREIPVLGQVSHETENGYEVKLGEFHGFCPHSQVDIEKKGKNLVGQKIRFVINEFSSRGRKIVLSQKKLSDKEKELKKEILKSELKEGQYVTCQVKSIHNFGLIVDVNGFDALVPVSEASFKKNPDLTQEYSIGQTLRGKILSLNWNENKITLSLKDFLNDPWSNQLKLKEGDIVQGTIDSIKPFGLFVKLDEHFHALVPTKETGISSRVPLHNQFKVGEKVEIFITEINPEKRQIAASILKAQETKEKLEYQAYLQNQEISHASSLGQILKDKLGKK